MTYWEENNDLLNRSEESAFIIRFLQQRVADKVRRGRTGSFVLNIDAAWGEGKTYFMKGLLSDLQEQGHPAIMIDAWRDDFTGDPLTAVVAEFDQYLSEFQSPNRSLKGKISTAAKQMRRHAGKLSLLIGKSVGQRVVTYAIGQGTEEFVAGVKELVPVGYDPEAVLGDLSGDLSKVANEAIDKFAAKNLERFKEAKISLGNFQASLEKAVDALSLNGGFKPPFFILIDELDRCRPTYAIEMLERIKHLFEVNNVVFVLSTDTTQLANSIKAVYGNDFSSRHYLLRFFDRSYMLAATDRTKMIQWLVEDSDFDSNVVSTYTPLDMVTIIESVSKHFDLELRQIEKAFDFLSTIASVWEAKAPFEIALMFPMIADFIKGNDLSSFERLKKTFYHEMTPHNITPLHIGSINIGGYFNSLYTRRNTTLEEAERQYNEGRSNLGNDPNTFALRMVEAEKAVAKSANERLLFRSYAERVRTAGRFADLRPE